MPLNEPPELSLANPSESLGFELKPWLDPRENHGKSKIVIGCLALRNNNGGSLLLGFEDDATPSPNPPPNVRELYHVDIIQEIVSKFASESFPIAVVFIAMDTVEYPIIKIPAGVKTPVVTKCDLIHEGKPIIRENTVYVRTLEANNRVSSATARRGDWRGLLDLCFDNREADIGGFVRRHLSSVDFSALLEAVQINTTAPKKPTEAENLQQALDYCHGRFVLACKDRKFDLKEYGFREAILLLEGELQPETASRDFLAKMQAIKPRHSGWTPWLDSRGGSGEELPYIFEAGWETNMLSSATHPITGMKADFWRMDPRGAFYHVRVLEDDVVQGRGRMTIEPRAVLDFLLQVSRVTEIISCGLAFGRALAVDQSKAVLHCGFRWSKLQGRGLTCWVEWERANFSPGVARQDTLYSSVSLPLETPQAGIAPYAALAVKPLFLLFDGMEFPPKVLEDIALKTTGQRL